MSEPDRAPVRRSSAPACSARRSGWPLRRAGLEVWLCRRSTTSTSAPPPASAPACPTPAEGAAAAGRRRRAARPPRRAASSQALDATDASRHRRRQREGAAAGRGRATWSRGRRWRATSAATRWPAASGPVRWPRRPRSSTAGRGRSRRTTHADPAAVGPGRGAGRGSAAPTPVRLSPVEHDRAVARTSHLPHLLAVLVAGQLADAPPEHLALSGQGVRDVTRIAAGDPGAVAARSSGATPRRGHSSSCATSATTLDALLARARRRATGPRSASCWTGASAGTAAIPGKHGGPARPTASGLRRGARPPRRAGPAVRRRGRDRGQHRGRPHRPRPGSPGRPGRAGGRRDRGRAPARVARSPGLGRPTGRACRCWAVTPVEQQDSAVGSTVVVAIDGPSGSGKSSTSRGVADRLGLRYLDTGAMFRAMTWWMLEHGVDVARPGRRRRPRRRAAPRVRHRPARPRRSPSTASTSPARIRSPEVTDHVSAGQRRARGAPAAARAAARDHRGGPTAASSSRAATSARSCGRRPPVKVYLTADPSARAARRAAEEGGRRRRGRPRPTCCAATRSTPAAPSRPLRWPTARCTSTRRRTRSTRSIDQVVALVRVEAVADGPARRRAAVERDRCRPPTR